MCDKNETQAKTESLFIAHKKKHKKGCHVKAFTVSYSLEMSGLHHRKIELMEFSYNA